MKEKKESLQTIIDKLPKELTKSKKEKGVTIVELPAQEFGGEDEKNRHPNFVVFWPIGLMAIITNVIQATFVKVFKKQNDTFGKILWDMGRDPNHYSSLFADRFSRFNRRAKYGGAGWKALDIFYNFNEKVEPELKKDLEGFLTKYWIKNTRNFQGIRNRYKIVVKLLADSFFEFSKEKEIRIVSIASGSAQAVIEAILMCPQLKIKVVLIDNDATAIEEAKKNINIAGLTKNFELVEGTTRKLEEVCERFRPHIIEMVGFLDYRTKEQAIRLISRIRNQLCDKGIFITCNIKKNSEKIILDWILLWPMIYRSEKEFAEVLVGGGYNPEKTQIIYEPMKIHGMGICKK